VDFAAVAAALRRHDYAGWWVLEQDTILSAEPSDEGPIRDVRRSADRLREILA
jgi:inosose dehydratase